MENKLVRPVLPEERMFLYALSSQLKNQTALIGHLRGDFGSSGNDFWTTWFPCKNTDKRRYYSTQRPVGPGTYPKPQGNKVLAVENYSSPTFIAEIGKKAWGYIEYELPISPVLLNDFELCEEPWRNELDELVNILRKHNQPLENRDAMKAWGRNNPDAGFDGWCGHEYGLRVDSELFTFMFRFIPIKGDYNFYCFVFVKQWLDEYIQKASKGIRFITSSYKELFRVPNNGKVKVTAGYDGAESVYSCRYIDDYHVEIGPNLYHICEFAEMMEKAGSTVEPVTEGDESDVD